MKHLSPRALKALIIEVVGWVLVLVGIAALVLPGPGLLAIFAGMALLSTRYEWAERRLEPIQKAALKAARDSVSSWPRIFVSIVGILVLVAVGIVWGIHPAAPGWWPIDTKWWLVGGWGTGGTMIGSAVIATFMLVYSFIKFRD